MIKLIYVVIISTKHLSNSHQALTRRMTMKVVVARSYYYHYDYFISSNYWRWRRRLSKANTTIIIIFMFITISRNRSLFLRNIIIMSIVSSDGIRIIIHTSTMIRKWGWQWLFLGDILGVEEVFLGVISW